MKEERDYEGFWLRRARELVVEWAPSQPSPPKPTKRSSGTRLAAPCSIGYVERRLKGPRSRLPSGGRSSKWQLYARVNEFAALLQGFGGVQVGDRVTFHLPMVPELPVSMLACARLGVIHSEVFGGFSGAACGERIADSQSRILVTMDGYYRNGELLDHKAKADQAVARAHAEGHEVDMVLVWRRHPGRYSSNTPMVEGRDFFVDELLNDYRGKVVAPVSMPAEAPLFLMYTSGTTGQPKGCQHSTGGYLAYVTGTSKYYQDIHPDEIEEIKAFGQAEYITGSGEADGTP